MSGKDGSDLENNLVHKCIEYPAYFNLHRENVFASNGVWCKVFSFWLQFYPLLLPDIKNRFTNTSNVFALLIFFQWCMESGSSLYAFFLVKISINIKNEYTTIIFRKAFAKTQKDSLSKSLSWGWLHFQTDLFFNYFVAKL